VKEEGIVGSRVLNKPVHGSQNILLGGLAHGILLVIGQNNHVFTSVAKVLGEIGRHVADVVDAATQLTALAKVINADEESFTPASALRVLERVALGSAASKVLRCARGSLDGIMAALLEPVLLILGRGCRAYRQVSSNTRGQSFADLN
jgi:hypothetical protein